MTDPERTFTPAIVLLFNTDSGGGRVAGHMVQKGGDIRRRCSNPPPFLKSMDRSHSFTQEFVRIDQSISRSVRTAFQSGNRFSNTRSVYPIHIVVHGHTITDARRPLVTHSRIALDTGAFGTGHLTTLIIGPVSDSLEFAWTAQSETAITVELIEPVIASVPERLHDYFNATSTMQSAR
jgi:hypothetical protein